MENKLNIERFPAFEFTFDKWSAGSLYNLGIDGHKHLMFRYAMRYIRQYAIGYCHVEYIQVRPKLDCVAVMFFKDEVQFWTHLTFSEFRRIFPEVPNDEIYE